MHNTFNNLNDIAKDFHHWIRHKIIQFGQNFYTLITSSDGISGIFVLVKLLREKIQNNPFNDLVVIAEYEAYIIRDIKNYDQYNNFYRIVKDKLEMVLYQNKKQSFNWKKIE